jgi:hypothetical protein
MNAHAAINALLIFLMVPGVITAWHILFSIAMACEDRDGELMEWYKRGPLLGQCLIWLLWPVFLIWRHRRRG